VHGNDVIVGDIQSETATHAGANLIAVDRRTSALRWITQVESHPAAIITGAAVVVGNVVFQRLSTNEEFLATDPNYPRCTFRGNVVALDAQSGQILWKTYDVPDNLGQTNQYSGGAVWQQPAIDLSRNTLYIGTGNNYTVFNNHRHLRPRSKRCRHRSGAPETTQEPDRRRRTTRRSARGAPHSIT
jgi:polyvinyl alcohol dehydrogenase (cytochrome)